MRELTKLLPVIVVGVMGNTCIYLIPLLVGAMVADRGFSDQQAGLVASADLAGYAVATFCTAMFLIDRNWRRLVLIGVATMFVANLATTIVHSAMAFGAVRFVSGLGAGVLAAIATVSLGQTDKPDRNYGLLFAASLLFGTAGLWAFPMLLERIGLNGAYFVIAILAVIVGFLSRPIARGRAICVKEVEATTSRRGWLVGLVLLSITIFWAQQNALYAFAERIGSAAGLTGQYIGFTLGLANLSGFVGASLVAWMGSRFGRVTPLLLATGIQVACLWLLSGTVSESSYLISFAVIALAWNVVNPIQLGLLAGVDQGGRALALASTVIGVGLATGPALGAAVLRGAGYSSILWLTASLSVASMALALPALRAPGIAVSPPTA